MTADDLTRLRDEIDNVLFKHRFGPATYTSSGTPLPDRCECWKFKGDENAHRAHVASLLADLMAERQAEALNEVARWLATVYQVNPMNHDGSNHTIDRVVQQLDRQAGTNAPSRAFEDTWDERMDKYEADYYGGDGKQRRARRALARLATDRLDPKDTRDE